MYLFNLILLLHRNEEETKSEENCDYGNDDVLLGVLAACKSDKNVRDSAYCDTVGDRVGEGHHNKCKECGNCGGDVGHINLSEVLKHKNANVDKSGSSCACGNYCRYGGEEEAEREADRGYKRSKTGSAACRNTCCGLNERSTGRGTESRAGNGCDRVARHSLVNVDGVAVFVKHICLRCGAVEGTDSVEHINKAEGNYKHDGIDYCACAALENGVALECADEAFGSEILEGLSYLAKVKIGHGPSGEIVKYGNCRNNDYYRALNLFLIKNRDCEKTDKSENYGSYCTPSVEEALAGNCAVEVKELNEGVLVSLDDSDVLKADEGDEKTDTCGYSLLKAVGKRSCNVASCTGYRKNKEYYTGEKNYEQALAISVHRIQHRRNDEGYEEE